MLALLIGARRERAQSHGAITDLVIARIAREDAGEGPLRRGSTLRAYLRHPSEFPIELFKANETPQVEALENVSEGGLCCHSSQKLDVGAVVRIRIAIGDGFEAKGSVAWCAPAEDEEGYRVGIAFADHASAFSVRMVQQVCQIERYRNEVREREGRELNSEDAAREWIERFAASFPR